MTDLAIGRFVECTSLQLLSSADPRPIQPSGTSSSPIPAGPPSERTLPSITGTTARHNLATSFTRALSEPEPNATQQQPPSRAHGPQVQTCFASDPQCQTANEQPTRSIRPAIDHSRFLLSPEARTSAQNQAQLPGRNCRGVKLVELNGFEPMTPCLQSRCSPS
jgi:hypothetical protein